MWISRLENLFLFAPGYCGSQMKGASVAASLMDVIPDLYQTFLRRALIRLKCIDFLAIL